MVKFVHCTVVESRPIQSVPKPAAASSQNNPDPNPRYAYVKHTYRKRGENVTPNLSGLDILA